MRRAPIVPFLISIALIAACGCVADPAETTATLSTSGPIVVASKAPIGDIRDPVALPTSDGTWIVIGGKDVADDRGALPCVPDGSEIHRVVSASPQGETSDVRAADGSEIFYYLEPSLTTPPAVQVGDPIVVSALRCDPDGEPTRSLMLGTVGEDGIPVGLLPIVGLGAPADAPPIDRIRFVYFGSGFSADRTTLLVNVLSDCSAETTCTRSELWNYDLRAESWSMRRDPTYPDGWWGLPLILSDGSVFEVVDESGYRWTTFRGATLYGRDDYVSAAMLAPDGNSALFSVSSQGYEDISGWTQSVQIVGTDGIPRKVYETPIEGDTAVFDGEVDTAGFGPDSATVYLGLWSTGTDTHLSLWSVDIATGAKEELLRIATFTYSSDRPDVGGPTGAPSVILLPDGSGALVQTWDEVWELWTFAKAE